MVPGVYTAPPVIPLPTPPVAETVPKAVYDAMVKEKDSVIANRDATIVTLKAEGAADDVKISALEQVKVDLTVQVQNLTTQYNAAVESLSNVSEELGKQDALIQKMTADKAKLSTDIKALLDA